MLKFRTLLFGLLILLPLLVGAGIILANHGGSTVDHYDTNGDGTIDQDEVIEALVDYLMGRITKAEMMEVLEAYISRRPTSMPTPPPRRTPTATPRPTATRTPVPGPTPTIQIESPGRVRITDHEATPDRLKIFWERPAGDVTGYTVEARIPGGEWVSGRFPATATNVYFTPASGQKFPLGHSYEMRVRAHNAEGGSPWSSITVTIVDPTPQPTPTATPILPPEPLPMLTKCRTRTHESSGPPVPKHTYYFGRPVVTQKAMHIDATFINPRTPTWEYGFTIDEPTGPLHPFQFRILNEGEWSVLTQPRERHRPDLVKTGYLDEADAPFNDGPGELNQLTFFTRNADGDWHTFFVNGVKVTTVYHGKRTSNVTSVDRYQKYHPDRAYYIYPRNSGYWNLCTENSW